MYVLEVGKTTILGRRIYTQFFETSDFEELLTRLAIIWKVKRLSFKEDFVRRHIVATEENNYRVFLLDSPYVFRLLIKK